MKFEQDQVTILGGVRHGETQGGPVAIEIANSEWPKWEQVMSADPVDADVLADLARNAPLTRPRPGHADLVGMQKYDFDEARPVLERASARETAARVALGCVASAFLEQATGARLVSHVIELGGVRAPAGVVPGPDDVARLDADEVRCLDPDASAAMVAAIDEAHRDGDTLGGVVEVVVHGLPPGPGLPRALGPPARLAAGRGADGHPGDQGRRGRRRVRARRDPRQPGPRRDRADRRRHPAHRAAAPAAPRAGCRPARCCGSAPR